MSNELEQLLLEAAEALRGEVATESLTLPDRLDAMRASLEAQEPVAWQLVDQPAHIEVEYREYHRGGEWEPLYRHPPTTSAVAEGFIIATAEQVALDCEYMRRVLGRCAGTIGIGDVEDVLFEAAQIPDKYNELLMAVAHKIPGESRHETALRIIRQHENPNNAAVPQQGGSDSER